MTAVRVTRRPVVGGGHRLDRHRWHDLRGLCRSDRTTTQRPRWRHGHRQLRIRTCPGRGDRRTYRFSEWSTRSGLSGIPQKLSRTTLRSRSTRRKTKDEHARSVADWSLLAFCSCHCVISRSPSHWCPRCGSPDWQWVLVALAAPVLTWGAWPFYTAAIRNARHGASSMDTLVSLGIVAATGWSLYAMFWRDTSRVPRTALFVLAHQSGGAIYIDVAAGVTTFLLAGRYFEAWSKRRTGNALRSLAAVGAKDVAVLDGKGMESRIPIALLAVGDRFVVRPGETIATDGDVVFWALGRRPQRHDRRISARRRERRATEWWAERSPVGGRLVVRATKVGRDTQLAHMVRLVEDAQNEKAAVQRLADRIAGVFVPAVLVIALVTLAAWLLVGGPSQRAFSAALSVLIIACPCALGSGYAHSPPRRLGAGRTPRDLLQGLPST